MKHLWSCFILRPKGNEIATEPREFVNQVLSNPLYASGLFNYNEIENGETENYQDSVFFYHLYK